MTELETMQRAKMYLDHLARGIDPITGQEIEGDSVLNNVRISRCLFYVSGVLDQVIANGGQVGKKVVKKAGFSITREELSRFRISEQPVRISEFVSMLWMCVDDEQIKKPSTTTFTDWLLEKGLLQKVQGPDGKSRRIPSQAGIGIGLILQTRMGQYGEYTAVAYSPAAQRFLLDHMEEILEERK